MVVIRNICGRTSAESPSTEPYSWCKTNFREDEALLAFLDNTYLAHTTVFATLQGALLTEAGIRLNPGKTKILEFSRGETFGVCCFYSWSLKHLTRLLLSVEGQSCPHSNRG